MLGMMCHFFVKVVERNFGFETYGEKVVTMAYLEELKHDILIIIKTSYFNYDNNAASCRILISVASLSGMKYEVHK